MKYAYIDKNFQASSLRMIENANKVIAEYTELGYRLTLRQLYYQMVTENLIPNKMKEYRRLASILNDARWAGLVDWDAIEDRVRETIAVVTWENPREIATAAFRSYREDYWISQKNYVEVFCEKDAVSNIVEPICRRFRVPFTANRGFASVSLLREVSVRLAEKADEGKDIILIYLGDHDPSGLDMDRDILHRLDMFSENEYSIDFVRIALTMNQVMRWALPPNPAKQTDSRFQSYQEQFGDESWELDAIKAQRLSDLVELEIRSYIDEDAWSEAIEQERENQAKLSNLMNGL